MKSGKISFSNFFNRKADTCQGDGGGTHTPYVYSSEDATNALERFMAHVSRDSSGGGGGSGGEGGMAMGSLHRALSRDRSPEHSGGTGGDEKDDQPTVRRPSSLNMESPPHNPSGGPAGSPTEFLVRSREGLMPTFHQVPLPVLLGHAENRLHMIDKLCSYVDERMRMETRHAKERSKLKLSLGPEDPRDSLDNTLQALVLFQEVQMSQMAEILEEMDKGVRLPLLRLKEDSLNVLTECKAEMRAADKEADAVEKRLSRAKQQLRRCRDKRVELQERLEHYRRLASDMAAATLGGQDQQNGDERLSPSTSSSSFTLFSGGTEVDRDNPEVNVIPALERRLWEVESDLRQAVLAVETAVALLLDAIARQDQVMDRWIDVLENLDDQQRRTLLSVSRTYALRQAQTAQLEMAHVTRLAQLVDSVHVNDDIQRFIARFAGSGGNELRYTALKLLPSGIHEGQQQVNQNYPRQTSGLSQSPHRYRRGPSSGMTPTRGRSGETADWGEEELMTMVSGAKPENQRQSWDEEEDGQVLMELLQEMFRGGHSFDSDRESETETDLEIEGNDMTQGDPMKERYPIASNGEEENTVATTIETNGEAESQRTGSRGDKFSWEGLKKGGTLGNRMILGTDEERRRFYNRTLADGRGRSLFLHQLNQQRSRCTEVGLPEGFSELADVMWRLLAACRTQRDVYNAKMAMMLSQTFWQNKPVDTTTPTTNTSTSLEEVDRSCSSSGHSDHDRREREFLSSRLQGHPIWSDSGFWERALNQCLIEQLPTVDPTIVSGSEGQPTRAWHDLSAEERDELVMRVHNIVFSQAGALAHSMVEFGCSIPEAAGFVTRIASKHQLSEEQRFMLLKHLSRQ